MLSTLGGRNIQGVVVPDLEQLEVANPQRDIVFAVSIDAAELMETWSIAPTRLLIALLARWRAAFGAVTAGSSNSARESGLGHRR